MGNHAHKFKFDCEMSNLHLHKVTGIADKTFGFGNLHFHYYYGVSSYTDHTHYFSGVTGLPVKTANGHVHRMDGQLEINSMHLHSYKGETFEEIAYTPRKLQGEAYI